MDLSGTDFNVHILDELMFPGIKISKGKVVFWRRRLWGGVPCVLKREMIVRGGSG